MSLPWHRHLRRYLLLLRAQVQSHRPDPANTERVPVNGPQVLDTLARLPISTWNYLWEPQVVHLGPMAQDFAAEFRLGADDRVISMIDANGVVMVAVQALYRRVVALEAEVAALKASSAGDGGSAQS